MKNSIQSVESESLGFSGPEPGLCKQSSPSHVGAVVGGQLGADVGLGSVGLGAGEGIGTIGESVGVSGPGPGSRPQFSSPHVGESVGSSVGLNVGFTVGSDVGS